VSEAEYIRLVFPYCHPVGESRALQATFMPKNRGISKTPADAAMFLKLVD
jgi:hypothetical protein